jgi:hypothetical protein
MRYANAEGFSGFNYGLVPDYEADPDYFPFPPFGDPRDPFMAQALSIITGQPLASYLKSEPAPGPVEWMDVPVDEFKQNLYLEPEWQ